MRVPFNQCTRLLCFLIVSVSFNSCIQPGPNTNTYSSEVSQSEEMDASDTRNYNYIDTIYAPVYSDIYSQTKDFRFLLTATLSIRNTSYSDTLVIRDIQYFDTRGALVRHFIDHPIYLVPMATIEYVIEEEDRSGGSGANFIVTIASKDRRVKPLVQTVMISVSGAQGVAFSCDGFSVKKQTLDN